MPTRHSHCWFVFFVLIAVMLVAGCGSDEDSDPPEPGKIVDPTPEEPDNPPDVDIVDAPSSLTNDTDPKFEFECLDDRSCEFTCRLNDQNADSCESPVEYTDVVDGDHVFEVVAVDEYELESESTEWSWTIDTVVPVVEDLSGPVDPTAHSSAAFDFACSKEKCQFDCELTNSDEATVEASTDCEPGHTYTGLAADDYTFTVTPSDPAGNTGAEESWSWTVDSTLLETNWAVIGVGNRHSCGVRTDGSLWCWGRGKSGELGLGDESNRTTPEQVGAETDWESVSAGAAFTCGTRSDGTMWCWGLGKDGRLGLGDDTSIRTTPEQVGTVTDWKHVSAGEVHTCGVKNDNSLWCWGRGGFGQLGQGDTSNRTKPEQVGTDTDWKRVAGGKGHTCGIRVDDSLWCWGSGDLGQLGLGDSSDRTTPEQVGTDSTWDDITAGGYHTCAVKSDGTLWCWGLDLEGQLGLSDDSSTRTTPHQVGTDTDWTIVAAGGVHSCGLRTGGTLWCWGLGDRGHLGLGDTSNRTTPEQVGSGTDWSRALSLGSFHSCGMQSDGRLWCWGKGEDGRIGLGDDTSNRTKPKQVGVNAE